MNTPLNESEFEKELRALVPAAVSRDLEERVAAEFPEPHGRMVLGQAVIPPMPLARTNGHVILAPHTESKSAATWLERLLPGLGWAFGGAAATVLAILTFNINPVPAVRTGDDIDLDPVAAFTPAESVAELIEEEPGEIILDEQNGALREYRLTYLERHTWTNPATGATIEFELPREDIVLMPVAMQ